MTSRRPQIRLSSAIIVVALLITVIAVACQEEEDGQQTAPGAQQGEATDERPMTPGAEQEEPRGEQPTSTPRGMNPPSIGEAFDCALPIVEGGPAQRGLPEDVTCQPLPAGYRVEVYATGLRRPVAMAFAPDGRLFVTEQHTGNIRLVVDGELLPQPFATVERLFVSHEAGLLGIAVDPDFEDNRYIYVFYNAIELFPREHFNKVVRYTEVDGIGTDPLEILPDLPGITREIHTAGNIHFGPDGKLYISLGELERSGDVQDLSLLPGKILRVNPDGSVPEDNPFFGESDADPRIYAYGLRNAFDFDFHPETGMMFATENGPNTDEINRIVPGGNYGWPDAIGPSDDPDFIDPFIYYERPIGPAGASFYSGDKLTEYKNNFFFCQFHEGGLLHRVQLTNGDEAVASDDLISGGCTSDVAEGPDGYLYFIDLINGIIYRITDGG